MPNTKSAERRMRSSTRRHQHNQAIKNRLRTLERAYEARVSEGKKAEATAALCTLVTALDKAAKVGVVHANTVSRKKSRLTLRLNRVPA